MFTVNPVRYTQHRFFSSFLAGRGGKHGCTVEGSGKHSCTVGGSGKHSCTVGGSGKHGWTVGGSGKHGGVENMDVL